MNNYKFLAKKHLTKIILFLSCSSVVFLNQNCGGTGFDSSDMMSRNHSPSDIGASNKASYDVRLGDRTFVASVLASVFFPEGEKDSSNSLMDDVHKSMQDYVSSDFSQADDRIHDLIRDNILRNIDEFKGPCNIYEKDSICSGENANQVEVSAVGKGSVSKEGIRVSTCYQILDNDRAVQNVMNKVGRNYNTSRMDANKAEDAYNLFYPGADMSSDARRNLASLGEETLESTKSNLEAWRMVLLSICRSGAWQIP